MKKTELFEKQQTDLLEESKRYRVCSATAASDPLLQQLNGGMENDETSFTSSSPLAQHEV